MPEDLAGKTVDAILRVCRPQDSSAARRELLTSRLVQINGNLCLDSSRLVREGDVVKILVHPISAPPTSNDITVRFFDSHLVIVEKPAGMTTMRYGDEVSASGRRNRQATLLDLLPRVLSQELQSRSGQAARAPHSARSTRGGPAPERRATNPMSSARVIPVHRLDRETSGLMVFARTPAAERALTDMFRSHDFRRVYHAIALGIVAPQTIESHLADDRGDGRRGSVPEAAGGERAVTHVRPLEPLGRFTLVECRLETGRTHQIRIHLSEQGHPLCGDRTYRKPLDGPSLRDDSGAPRLALHATELSFVHPMTSKELSFRSKLPADLAEFLARLRRGGISD